MGLQPIQKRDTNKELGVLLSQDCCCCCCRCCWCPGERSLSVISSLFNTGEVEEGCSKMMIPQVETLPAACPLSVWMSTSHCSVVLSLSLSLTWHLSHSLPPKRTHTHLFSLSCRLRRLLISFRSCISLPRSCHSTGESGILEAALDRSAVKQEEGGVLIILSFPHSVILRKSIKHYTILIQYHLY